MKGLETALEKAQKGLIKAKSMLEGTPAQTSTEVEDSLTETLQTLSMDLRTMIEDCKKLPAWLFQRSRIIDYEVLVVVSQQLVYMFDVIKIEDIRSMEQVCLEAAEIFTEYHHSHDPDYWSSRDFFEETLRYCAEIKAALRARPDWINKNHRSMYGNDTLQDLLKKHLEKKYPRRILDPITGKEPPLILCKVMEGVEVRVDTERHTYKAAVHGTTHTGPFYRACRSPEDTDEKD